MNNNQESSTSEALINLIRVVSRLRNPNDGCPWDRIQTHESLVPYIIEEAYEVVNAIRINDKNNLKEELGDLLLQIILHSEIASEKNQFTMQDVINEIHEKLIRRHPHIFNIKSQDLTVEEVEENWQKIKLKEKSGENIKSSLCQRLINKSKSQPPITSSMKISLEVARVGFEWRNIEEIYKKLEEEVEELKIALQNKDHANTEEEIGDIFFTLVNIARWNNLSPEECLRKTNEKFIKRFSFIEDNLKGDFNASDFNKLQKLWQKAKKIKNQDID